MIKIRVSNLVNSLLDPLSKATNLKIFDGTSLDIGDLISFLMNRPLFGGMRVALLENTSLFMSQVNIRKIIDRILDAYKVGDTKTGFRYLKQLAGSLNVSSETGDLPNDWLKEVDEISRLNISDRELLIQAATNFANEFSGVLSSGNENALFDFLQNGLPQDCCLILTSISVDKKNRFLKLVQEKGQIEEFKPRLDKAAVGLDKSYFQSSVKQFLRDQEKTITPEALELAFAKSGKDLRRIRSEFQKIVSYLGNRSEITLHDVQDLFLDFHEAAFFDLSKAIRELNSQKLLVALHENLKIVDHPLQTLAVMASEFRKIIAARELLFTAFRSTWRPNITFDRFVPIVSKVRLENPSQKSSKAKFNLLAQKDFPLFQLLKTAQAFPLEKLTRIMEIILVADMRLKSSKLGSLAPQIILENLVFAICDLETF
ncbi:MAG: DNA polymerase III subunit delta [Desulfomonilaceae bacterium]